MEDGVSAGLNRSELRKFGLQVGAAFVLLAGVARWRGHTASPWVLGLIGSILLVGGAIAPAALRPLHTAWMALAKILSRVTTPIFLGVVYFLIFTPVGVVRRVLGKDTMRRRPVGDSYFVSRKHRVSNMDHQF